MNSHLERGVINHLTKRREKSPLKGLEMKRIKFRLWERSMTSLLSQLHSLEAERDDHAECAATNRQIPIKAR